MDTAAEIQNARALHHLGRHKAAAEICQRILDRQPNRPEVMLVLATIADELGDQRAAVSFLTRIIDRDPGHPGAAVLLGDVLNKLGAVDGAVAWYRAALAMERDAERAAPALARLLAAQGQIDAVAALAEDALARKRPAIASAVGSIGLAAARAHAGLALTLGRALIETGDRAGAQAPLRLATIAHPGDSVLLQTVARATGEARWFTRALAAHPDVDMRAGLGEALMREGEVGTARQAFEAVLAADSTHRRALQGLARLQLALGEADRAIGLARRRLSDDPEDTDAARLLAEALTRRGVPASALTMAQTAAKAGREPIARAFAEGVLEVAPDRLDAWLMIGTQRAFRVALTHAPADAAAMTSFADDDARVLAWRKRAILIDQGPTTALALARALIRSGDKAAAQLLLRPLLATLSAQKPELTAELARLLIDIGEVAPAVRLLEAVSAAVPENADLGRQLVHALTRYGDAATLVRLGQAHLSKQRPTLAAMAFGAARALKPDNPQVAFLHGRALEEANQSSAAIDAFIDTAEMAGDDNLDLLTRAGEALVGLRSVEAGLRYLRRSVEGDFTNPGRHSYSYFFHFLNQCDWPARRDYVERLTALAEQKIAADDPAFRLNPSLWVFLAAERDLLYRSANHFARHHFPDTRRPPPATPGTDPERPIRLGYMSAFLHGHHIGYSLMGVLKGHDRSQVQIHLYGQTQNDAVQGVLRGEAHLFRSIDGKSPAGIAQMIAADGIDVLVDLDGYVNSASGLLTMEVASHRPAPIQMLYHNYVGPTGTDFVDYVIADRELFDAHDDAGYRERLIRLPPCYYPAAPLPKAQARSERKTWGLPEEGPIFCNFGHFYKIEPSAFDVWMRILRRVPGSVIWMNHWDATEAVANLRREAEARGVDPARLVFSTMAEKPAHLARLGLADLFLDTFVYASGVTSLDALWGGVPVLTVRGSTFARRVGASLNAGIGLEEMICEDTQAFEELAVALVTDRPRLAALKARLAENLTTHSLFDQAQLAHNLERAYRVAFRRHVAGLPPESFELPPLPVR